MNWLQTLLGRIRHTQSESTNTPPQRIPRDEQARTPRPTQRPPSQAKPAGNLNKALLKAASAGNAEEARSLLASGADANTRGNFNVTPLMWASKAGSVETVRVLLDAGAEVDARANAGGTALLWAIEPGHVNVVRLLLERGAEPNVKEQETGRTALMWAQEKGHREIAALLEQKGRSHSQFTAHTGGNLRQASQVMVFLGSDCEETKDGLSHQAEAYVCAANAHAARKAILAVLPADHMSDWVLICGFHIPGHLGDRCTEKEINAWGNKFAKAFRSQKGGRFRSLDTTVVGDVATSKISVLIQSQGRADTACACCDALQNAGRQIGV